MSVKEQTEKEGHASEPSNCFFSTITVSQLHCFSTLRQNCKGKGTAQRVQAHIV